MVSNESKGPSLGSEVIGSAEGCQSQHLNRSLLHERGTESWVSPLVFWLFGYAASVRGTKVGPASGD